MRSGNETEAVKVPPTKKANEKEQNVGKFQQPKGTKHEPEQRRSLSGKYLPVDFERPLFSVVPASAPTGVKRPFDSGAPVLTPVDITATVEHAPAGSPSRRERRAAMRSAR